MTPKKKNVSVEKKECVACGECRNVCKKAAVTLKNGVHASICEISCVACALCAKRCPAGAIKVEAAQ